MPVLSPSTAFACDLHCFLVHVVKLPYLQHWRFFSDKKRFAHLFKYLTNPGPASSSDGNHGLNTDNVNLAGEAPPEFGCGLAPKL